MSREELIVLKIGSEVLDDAAVLEQALAAFAGLPQRKLLVHGGGKAGSRLAAQLGVETRMEGGRRVTSEAMLDVALMAYGGLINRKLCARLQALGADALGLSGADCDLIRAARRPPGEIDYGWVGDIVRIREELLAAWIGQGILPVVAPLTHDGQGHLLNTNADTIASTLACALAGRFRVRLLFSFALPGVMRDPADPASLIPLIRPADFEQLKAGGTVSGGMLPKLENAFAALRAGVDQVLICQAGAIAALGGAAFRGTRIEA